MFLQIIKCSLYNNKCRAQARFVQKVDNAIRWINHYPADGAGCFVNAYQLDSNLCGGKSYPAFTQLGPGGRAKV